LIEAAMTDYLSRQAFQLVSLDAVEQQREKLAMLGEQFQADHQALIHQSMLGWLDYPDWLTADLAALQKLTADVQPSQIGEVFLDLDQWLTSGFVPSVNPLSELPDRPFPKSGIRERETERSPQIQTPPSLQTSPSLKTDSTSAPIRLPVSPNPVSPTNSGESVTLHSQRPIRSLQTDPESITSAAEATRFSTPTAFSRIGEHFTSAESGSDSGRFDLQTVKDFPSIQREWENQPVEDQAIADKTRFEPDGSVQSDLTWKDSQAGAGAYRHAPLQEILNQLGHLFPGNVLTSEEITSEEITSEEITSEKAEMQTNRSFQGLRDFAQMLETESAWMAIAPDSPPAIDWQESELANQTVTSNQRSDDPEVRIPHRGRRMSDKRMTSSVPQPEITGSHNLDADQSLQQPLQQLLQQPSEVFDPIRENAISSQIALPLSQSQSQAVRDLQPEREPEVRPLRLSEPDLDMILEAIAQEVQREYRQFYGS
jgi:hypothetical protein